MTRPVSSLSDSMLAHVDSFIPPELVDHDEGAARRARLVIITDWVLIALGLFFLAFFWTAKGEFGPVPIAIATVLPVAVTVPWLVRHLGSTTIPGSIVVLSLMSALMIPEIISSAEHQAALPWFAMVPLTAAFLVGGRLAVLTAVVMLGYQVLKLLLDGTRFDLITEPSASTPLLIVASSGGTLAFGAFVGWLYSAARERSKDRLAGALEELRGTNQALVAARDRADKANAAKMQFVANMSHELRTPMNGVIGMTDLLMESDLRDPQRDYAETIRASANSLLAIIDDVLDFSKLEFDKLQLHRREFELEPLLDEIVAIVGNQAYDRGLELSLQLSPYVPHHTVGDPARLRQVLLNLLTNAIKFTEAGEVSLFVSRSDSITRPNDIRFEVRDTGVGIEDAQLPQIFDSFYQSDASQTRRHGGVGLGLAICKRLVELMGGRLRVKSRVDVGTVFTFEIPFESSDVYEEDFNDRSRTLQGLQALVLLPPGRPMATRALEGVLGRDGVAMTTVFEPQDMLDELAAARELPFRLCIIDAERDPKLKLAERIAALELEHPPATVLLTVPAARREREAAERRGYGSTVTKPTRRGHLMACVAFAMRRPVPEFDDTQSLDIVPPPAARVLVAEDNEVNRRLALLMLDKLGYRGEAVSDGDAVVEACRRKHYDAILMDLQMPKLDGYATTTQIRQQGDAIRHMTIIAMSANVQPSDRQRSLDAGMNDFVGKPVRLEQLRAVLDKWLKGAIPKPGADSSDDHTPPVEATLDRALLDSLRRLAGDQDELFGELIDPFLREGPDALERLDSHVALGDRDQLADDAHKLKSSSGNLGAQQLSSLLIRLEQVAEGGELSDAESLMTQIRSEYGRFEVALNAYRRSKAHA